MTSEEDSSIPKTPSQSSASTAGAGGSQGTESLNRKSSTASLDEAVSKLHVSTPGSKGVLDDTLQDTQIVDMEVDQPEASKVKVQMQATPQAKPLQLQDVAMPDASIASQQNQGQ